MDTISRAVIDDMLADTRETFDASGPETPQAVRDVIEYVASWLTVALDKPALAALAAPAQHEARQRCIDARNALNAALHGDGAVIDTLEQVVASACAVIKRHAALAQPNTWREAVLDALTATGSDMPATATPAEIVRAVIDAHVQIALDPRVSDATPAQQPGLLEWAVARWRDEVQHRPLVNKNRRSLDDAWRQVIRYAGGDPAELIGPPHDDLASAPAQQPEIPDGYALVPDYRGYAHLGTGLYAINVSDAGEPAELIISIATDVERENRSVGERRDNPNGHVIQPDQMAVRLRFENSTGLDALEDMLRELRTEHFPSPSVQASNNVKPVAVVRENLAGNEARVQYLFNPVPVGAELQWDHNDLASVLAEVEARDDAR